MAKYDRQEGKWEQVSNYEIMKQQVKAEFARYDQAEMIRKFSLRHDEWYLYLNFVNRGYRIDRADGTVDWSEDGFATCAEAGYNEVMTIYDALCYSKPDCHLSGTFVHMQNLSAIQSGNLSVGSGLMKKMETRFDHRDADLRRACEKLGGVIDGKGDVAYRLPVFDFLPVQFQFWNSDEDFGPSMALFYDKNILDYMHYETVWFMTGFLLSRILEEMTA